MLAISEADAAKGLAAVVKARKAGGAQPIQFSPAQQEHVEAFKKTLDQRYRRFERETRKQIREEEEKRAQFQIEITLAREGSRLAAPLLAEQARRKGATFTVAEYRLLWLLAHPDRSATRNGSRRRNSWRTGRSSRPAACGGRRASDSLRKTTSRPAA
jgi:hypothetical protein